MSGPANPSVMPVAFFGHGSPMNAVESNRFTGAWEEFGRTTPRPRGILVISAHWYINATVVTAMRQPRTIHDFYGFPSELFEVEYPAPGLPELSGRIADLVQPTWVGADIDSWGIDHGTWSVLVHAFPDASIPVVQLSIDAAKPLDYHLSLGARLAELRREGILIVGSGNIVHNLRVMTDSLGDEGYDWARRFDDSARGLLTTAPGDVLRLREHRDFDISVPTPDHFIPMLYFAGLAAADSDDPSVLVDGYTFGSLSMTSYVLGGPGRR